MLSTLTAPRHVLERIAVELGYSARQVNSMTTKQLRNIALHEAETDGSPWDNFDGDCVDDYETNN